MQQLQDSQVSNTGLQQQLQDLKQQLQSASTGSLLQQQEAQGLTAAMEERHERDLLEQKEQVSEWKVRCQQAEEQVRPVLPAERAWSTLVRCIEQRPVCFHWPRSGLSEVRLRH